MKKNNSPYRLQYVAIIAVLALFSCEKIIDINIPDKKRKIVVNGLISTNKKVSVNLSKSLSVLENDELIPFAAGDVNLFNGNTLIGKLQEDSAGYYSLPGFNPLVGQIYRLTASGNGLSPIEASATMPELVSVTSVDTATLMDEWGNSELRLKVKFKDPADVHNIYGIGIDVTYKEFDYSTMMFTGRKLSHSAYLSGNSDQFLTDESTNFEGKLYFEDLLFNGLSKSVEFGVYDYAFYESDTVWLDVKMEQIDPSFYLYVRSCNAYSEAGGNPFAEPVQVFTNVKGGYGIFAGSSSSSYSFVTLGMRKF
jgi:hypothetical protein